MDKFEKQIKNNASKFDVPAPNTELMWDKIDEALPGLTKPNNTTRLNIVLLVLCFTALGFLAGKFLNQKKEVSYQYANDQSIEFLEIDRHYTKMVSYQLEELRQSPELNELEKEEFLVYIDDLGKEQEILKEELQKNIDNQDVLEAIVENFEQQISLIDELLDRVDRSKHINYDIGISL